MGVATDNRDFEFYSPPELGQGGKNLGTLEN
jgi:hypothetical protein